VWHGISGGAALTVARLIAALGAQIEVIHSKIEDLDLEAQSVDVLISEPMGTLLVNERMLETYLYARDHFLKPGGRMFPVSGLNHVNPVHAATSGIG
jgi:predicted RNA methylase